MKASPRLLVVDDDPGLLDFVAIYFGRRRLEVVTARRGQEALDHIDEIQPDVALIDVHLDDMTGFRLMRQLHERVPSLAVIVVSGQVSSTVVADALRLGASHFVAKPFELDTLEAAVFEALRRGSGRDRSV